MGWVPIRHCLLLHRITHLAWNTISPHINCLFSLPLEVILRRLYRDQLRCLITSNRWSLDVLRLVLWGAPPVPFGCSMWNTSSSVPADGHGPDSWRCDHVTRIVSFLQGNKVLIFVILVLWVHLAAGYFEACWNGVPICYCLCHNADHKLVNKLLLTT
jgi:hypothetical protein